MQKPSAICLKKTKQKNTVKLRVEEHLLWNSLVWKTRLPLSMLEILEEQICRYIFINIYKCTY